MQDKVAVVLGTRPEIIKMAEIVGLLGDRALVVHTGQHWDHTMSGAFMEQLHMPSPDVTLSVGGGTRTQQITQVMLGVESAFTGDRPAAILVQGDTNSVVGAALAANAMSIPLVHVEAGLRSFDRAMPEEHNRIITDHVADLCLAPTEGNRAQLLSEGIPEDRVVVTGNPVVAAAANTYLSFADGQSGTLLMESLGLATGEFILATAHRPENTDGQAALEELFTSLAEITRDVGPLVMPLHPRTRARLEEFELTHLLDGLRVLPPLDYESFVALGSNAALLISDSGGVQEEATVWKRPLIVVRRSTERPEGLGIFAHMSRRGPELVALAAHLYGRRADLLPELASLPSPYGGMDAAALSVEAIDQLILRARS